MGKLIVLMGATGAGKSVQGDLLAEQFGAVHLSSGKLLRRDPETLKKMVDGQLVPHQEVARVVGQAMAQVPADKLMVLDGFPRRQADVDWLESNLPRFNRIISAVVHIDLDIETSMKRLGLRGRSDDAPDAVRKKWKLFEDLTMPVVSHYRDLGLLVTVNGRGTIEQVHDEIVASLSREVLQS